MDLSFHRFEADFGANAQPIVLPPDLAVMLVGIAARQAASPTALYFAGLIAAPVAENWFAPASGAFNLTMAQMLTRWKER